MSEDFMSRVKQAEKDAEKGLSAAEYGALAEGLVEATEAASTKGAQPNVDNSIPEGMVIPDDDTLDDALDSAFGELTGNNA